jgi:hypothetical protein
MHLRGLKLLAISLCSAATLAGCGSGISSGDSGLFRRDAAAIPSERQLERKAAADAQRAAIDKIENPGARQSTIWDMFSNAADPNTTLEVNKYIWAASLDVLNFLPIESIDPFTGVIVTGYGTPPGGARAYRATIYVQDPALDARSLKLAMQTKGGGAVDPATVSAVEDAILNRARQLRIADGKL